VRCCLPEQRRQVRPLLVPQDDGAEGAHPSRRLGFQQVADGPLEHRRHGREGGEVRIAGQRYGERYRQVAFSASLPASLTIAPVYGAQVDTPAPTTL
jgi:hypothetical protein